MAELLEPSVARQRQLLGFPLVDADIASGANINAAKIGTGVVDNTEFNRLNGITSALEEQGNKGAVSGYAGLDASQKLLLTNFPTGNASESLRRNAGNTALEFGLIGDANTATFTTTKISTTNKALLNSALVYNDQANVFGDFIQTFKDNSITIESPNGLTPITLVNLQQTLARNLTIPILTANRSIVVTGEASQITIGTEVTGASTDLTDTAVIARNTDNLSFFAATTSLQLLGIISDETGAGALVFGTSPTIVTPTIASFVNATHDHSNAAGGGNLTNSALTSGVFGAITGLGVQSQALDMGGFNVDNIQNLIHDISTSGTDIDFNEDELQTISISVNTTFTTANRAAGRSKTLKITTDATLRTLTFPAWDWVSDIPADQAASKNGYLTLTSYGTTDALIVAAYQVGSL